MTLLGQASRVVVGAVSALVIAAFIGPTSKGVLAAVVGLSTIASTVLSLGMNGAATYFLGSKKWSTEESIGVLLSSTVWAVLVAAAVWILLARVPYVASLDRQGVTLAVFTIATGAQTLSSVLGGVLLGRQNFKLYSVQAVVAPALTLALFWAMAASGWGTTQSALWSWMVGLLVSCGPGLVVLLSWARYRVSWPAHFGQAVSYGLRASAATAMNALNLRLDVVLLAALGGVTATGQYALAVQFTELLWIVPTAIGYVVMPAVAGSPNDDGERSASLCRKAMLVGVVLGAIVICAGLAYVAVVPLYRQSMEAILLLLPGTIAFTAAKVLGNDLYGRGLPHAHMWAAGASVVATLCGDLLLIPLYGFVAAAIVSSLAYALYAAVILWWFHRVTGIGLIDATVPTWDDFRGLSAALVRAMRSGHVSVASSLSGSSK